MGHKGGGACCGLACWGWGEAPLGEILGSWEGMLGPGVTSPGSGGPAECRSQDLVTHVSPTLVQGTSQHIEEPEADRLSDWPVITQLVRVCQPSTPFSPS